MDIQQNILILQVKSSEIKVDQNEIWLTIVEYSKYRDISISTIRRYIKNKRVRSKKSEGRFLIHVTLENFQKRNATNEIDLEKKLEVKRMMSEGFKLGYKDDPTLHSARIVLVDKRGMIRGYFDGLDKNKIEKLKASIKYLQKRN